MKFRSERTSSCLMTSNVQLSNLTSTAWLTWSSQTEWDRWPTYYAICLVGAGSLRNAAPVTQAIWYLSWKYENDLVRGKWVTVAAAGYSVKKIDTHRTFQSVTSLQTSLPSDRCWRSEWPHIHIFFPLWLWRCGFETDWEVVMCSVSTLCLYCTVCMMLACGGWKNFTGCSNCPHDWRS